MPQTKTPTRNRDELDTTGKLTDEELAAVKERTKELRAAKRRGGDDADGEADVMAKIGELEGAERALAERIHEIIKASAPTLVPRTYYGMPAYAQDGKVICFFQPASKFKVRYSTLGFQPEAKLDNGAMWPIAWALPELTAADEKRVAELVKKAVG